MGNLRASLTGGLVDIQLLYLLRKVSRVPDLELTLALLRETHAQELFFRPQERQLGRTGPLVRHRDGLNTAQTACVYEE